MRKIYQLLLSCLIAATISLLPILTFGQDEQGSEPKQTHKEKKEQFDKYWYVNLNLGLMFPYTDVNKRRLEVILVVGILGLALLLDGSSIQSGA